MTSPGQQNANIPKPSSGIGSQRRPSTSSSAGRRRWIDRMKRPVLISRSLTQRTAARISATWKIVCTRGD
ncbi:hypothetical protein AB0P21_40525 [Kribbella sp. NPDC056861]|uniref:hypothetical protein n=1 Tax=Kribbella sp. NPDC056861 TaxID=3154857 RepID=UPI003445CC11